MSTSDWSIWPSDLHRSDDQRKRQKSAANKKCTPLEVDKSIGAGVFAGSGKKPYSVTLEQCTCSDFVRRRLPCKHMYRLAHEVGVCALSDVEAARARIPNDDALAIVDALSDETAKSFRSKILTHRNFKNDMGPYYFVDKAFCDELIQSGFCYEGPNKNGCLKFIKQVDINAVLKAHGLKPSKPKLALHTRLNKRDYIRCAIENNLAEEICPHIFELWFNEDYDLNVGKMFKYLNEKFPVEQEEPLYDPFTDKWYTINSKTGEVVEERT